MSDNRVPSIPREGRDPKPDEKYVHAACRRPGCTSIRCTTSQVGGCTRFKCAECGYTYSVQVGGGFNH